MKKHLFFVGLFFIAVTAYAKDSITPLTGGKQGWNVVTDNTVYQLTVDDKGNVIPTFWGSVAAAEQVMEQTRNRHNGLTALKEVPVRGRHVDKIPVLEVIFADKTRDCELTYVSSEIIFINGRQTLKITQRDCFYPLEVTSFLRVIPEHDMIEKWIEVKNTAKKGKQSILIENLLSGSLALQPDRYYLNHHSGLWYKEFQLRKTELTTGIKTLDNRDFYAFRNTPWFSITNEAGDDKENAEVWFGQIHYSGNWRLDFEMTHSNHLQITGGISFWDTSLTLKGGDSFTTPVLSVGYTRQGTEKAAQLVHAYVNKEILPANMKEKLRPVLYNSWYATTFDVNEEHQLALAREAKELGIELFVIDDGWFKGRTSDHAGLGDWEVDPEKFPNGLNSMIKKINDMGLEFGIWVEPEMVNPDSDLYRKHPDWVMNFPNRDRTEWRNQLTLNLAREDVYQYLLKSMTNLLTNHNISFIKWDRNRGLTEPGWPDADATIQREMRVRYIENLYRLIDTLRERFPNVLFENCSSGGGRPDLGMLSRTDQTWASDNTDPVDRLLIQYGYLSSYPASTMVCWTNNSDRHRTGASLDYIFDVAMQGVVGIGQDITKWNQVQKDTAKKKIALYKEIRKNIQQGRVDRLKSPFEGNKVAIQYSDENTGQIVVLCYNMGEVMEGSTLEVQESPRLKLKGLEEKRIYTIKGENKSYSGKFLMEIGLTWPIWGAYRSHTIQVHPT